MENGQLARQIVTAKSFLFVVIFFFLNFWCNLFNKKIPEMDKNKEYSFKKMFSHHFDAAPVFLATLKAKAIIHSG